MNDGTNNELAELNELIAEEEGRLANEAADASLRHLALLGAMKVDACHAAYRGVVAGALVRVLLALAAVRQCVEAVTPEINEPQRIAYLTRLVSLAFEVDPDPIIVELLAEARSAF